MRQNLLNETCEVYEETAYIGLYNAPLKTFTYKNTQKTRWKELNNWNKKLLGINTSKKVVRFYLNSNIDINKEDVIICNSLLYTVKWINILGYQLGLTAGLQVDTEYIGTCSKLIDGITWGYDSSSPQTPKPWSDWYYKDTNIEARNSGDYGFLEVACGESFVSEVINTGGWQNKKLTINYDTYGTGYGSGDIFYRMSPYNFDKTNTTIVWHIYTGETMITGQYIQIMVSS